MSGHVSDPTAPGTVEQATLSPPLGRGLLLRVVAAVAIGCALCFAVALKPVWWLAWIAPAPLLVLALRCPGRLLPALLTGLAALIGESVNLPYYLLVLPWPAALGATLGKALLWVLVVQRTRRVVLRYRAWWTAFAYPVLWVAVDTLMAALLPDGNWASLAYSQADVLPVLQVVSLFGVPGLLFVLSLAPSLLAMFWVHGTRLKHGSFAFAFMLVIAWAVAAYGQFRLRMPVGATSATIGLAAIDDLAGANPDMGARRIWDRYEELVAGLAARGASVVVLPEKIAMLAPADAVAVQRRLGALAARYKVWLDAGVGLEQGAQRRNVSWRFDPSGALAQVYQKQHLAPGERSFAAGTEYKLNRIGGVEYGMAICKDMHFASLGRAYAQRHAAVMLVPAWDFGIDAWMENRMTLARGVEGGYTVVRVARDGLMTVTDAYGRVIAEQRSSSLPGTSMVVSVPVGEPVGTLYRHIGDLFGWLCVGGAVVLVWLGMGRQRG